VAADAGQLKKRRPGDDQRRHTRGHYFGQDDVVQLRVPPDNIKLEFVKSAIAAGDAARGYEAELRDQE